MKRLNITEYIPIGLQHPVTMRDLALRTGESRRTIRKLIHKARLDGALICSTCDGDNGGYYIPESPAEARPFYNQQSARINSGIAAISAISKYVNEGIGNE